MRQRQPVKGRLNFDFSGTHFFISSYIRCMVTHSLLGRKIVWFVSSGPYELTIGFVASNIMAIMTFVCGCVVHVRSFWILLQPLIDLAVTHVIVIKCHSGFLFFLLCVWLCSSTIWSANCFCSIAPPWLSRVRDWSGLAQQRGLCSVIRGRESNYKLWYHPIHSIRLDSRAKIETTLTKISSCSFNIIHFHVKFLFFFLLYSHSPADCTTVRNVWAHKQLNNDITI